MLHVHVASHRLKLMRAIYTPIEVGYATNHEIIQMRPTVSERFMDLKRIMSNEIAMVRQFMLICLNQLR